jgi:chromosome partitioning protein
VYPIAFLNRKGGVGKTSCCHHLAGAFARQGQRVLLVDLDPQASLTQGLLGPQEAAAIPYDRSVATAYEPWGTDTTQLTRNCRFPGDKKNPACEFHLIPGHHELARFNTASPADWGQQQTALRDLLAQACTRYDLVLIDCPPNLQLLSRSAIVAAAGVVIPLQPEDYGAQGIRHVTDEIERVALGANPSVELLGYLLTMTQRNALHSTYADQLREQHPGRVLATEIPRAVAYAEAVVARQPIGVMKPRSAGAKIIDQLARELISRAGLTLTEADPIRKAVAA